MSYSLRAIWLIFLGAALALCPARPSVPAEAPPRAIVLSWDGAVPALVLDLLGRGKLPHLEELIAGGAFADSVTTVFPSKTAPGHASLWTGAPPRVNGISGNTMPRTPRSQFTILDKVSGFADAPQRAEPLWTPAQRSGRSVILSHGPFSGGRARRVVALHGYRGIAGRDRVITAREAPLRQAEGWKDLPNSEAVPLEMSFSIGATRLLGLFFDDPKDSTRGYDTLLVTEDKDSAQIKARLKAGPSGGALEKWSRSLSIKTTRQHDAGIYLRLFDLKPDGSNFLLYFTRPTRDLSSHPELLTSLGQSAGAFIGNGASNIYSQGAFGPTIPDGGDGTAEQRYLETVSLTQRQLMETARWLMQKLTWDLLFTYTPYPDEAEHLWLGYLQPSLPGYREELAKRLTPYLEEVYRTCDEFLGHLIKLRPANTVIALVSDHGMEGVNKAVAINAALKQAGLLALDQRRRADLGKTKAFYPSPSNAYILINTTDRKGGIVKPEERPQVVAQIRLALEAIRDGGRQVVTRIWDAETEGETLGIGGEAGGDVYLDLLPGYDFDGRLTSSDLIIERKPYGAHLFNPQRTPMRTIMVLNGPGVAAGRKLTAAQTIDFAPTLSRLLDIPAPRDATGRILAEALSR